MGRRKGINIYRFTEDENGECTLTEKAELNMLSGIERILGKKKVKGDKKTYEMIEIKNRYFDHDGIYLTERKNLTFSVVEMFITHCSTCDRSVQHRPYTEDLFDDELLDDLGMTVLTYKHYYSGNDFLADVYKPLKKIDVDDYLIREYKEHSEKVLKEAVKYRECRNYKKHTIFESI